MILILYWRHHPESNRATKLCRLLHNRSAIAPRRTWVLYKKVEKSKKKRSNKKSLSFEKEIYFFLVPEMGLEPTHLSAYAPQAYMSTIPSPGQNNENKVTIIVKISEVKLSSRTLL